MKREYNLNIISKPYIPHISYTSWGVSIFIMEEDGKAFSRIYWYNDDNDYIYLDWLSVNEEDRKKGIGTKLQEIREAIGVSLGATFSCL
jgi:GNAT superfamily N-acetyltransferase